MRKDLVLAFLGLWVALTPFLLSCGSTQTATLVMLGLGILLLSVWSFSKSHQVE